MDNLLDVLAGLISAAWDYICEIFVTVIIDAMISFYSEVVEYFKSLRLEQGVQIPFIFGEDSPVASQLSGLRTDTHGGPGVYEGVFNESTDQLDSLRWVEGTAMDEETSNTIKNKDIIVLK